MARKAQDNPALDMTPMIDVVFELIIFFVVTIKQQDIFSKLNVNKPAPADSASSSSEEKDLTTIEIGKNANYVDEGVYVLKGVEMDIKQIDEALKDVAKNARKAEEEPIVIKCESKSPHGALVKLLDRCYKYNLFSISLFSM